VALASAVQNVVGELGWDIVSRSLEPMVLMAIQGKEEWNLGSGPIWRLALGACTNLFRSKNQEILIRKEGMLLSDFESVRLHLLY
jgi:hypothetical protein